MFKEKLELDIRGRVAFIYDTGEVVRYDNAIQATAKEIVSKALIGNVTGLIDTIELYNLGILICSRPVTVKSIVNATEVEFDALFDAASFNSHVDEARLKASALGYFSIVTGVDITKTSIQSILVSWTIQIV